MSLRGAILGFLSLEPTSGYTLKQRFDGSVRSFWSATQSQIFREPHALEEEGLVEVEAVPGNGKPERKVYSLTAPGRDALQRWLAEPLEPLGLRHPMLLKLVVGARARRARRRSGGCRSSTASHGATRSSNGSNGRAGSSPEARKERRHGTE